MPGAAPPDEESYHRDVYLHLLGSDPATDPQVYADPAPQAYPSVVLSHDGRYLLVESAHSWSNVTLLWRDLRAPTSDFATLTDGLEALFSVEEADGALYMLTDWEAPRYRGRASPRQLAGTDPRGAARAVKPQDRWVAAAGRLRRHESRPRLLGGLCRPAHGSPRRAGRSWPRLHDRP